ncbi:site-specific integrase, partial [Mycobacterium sp.]|uniref:site-specific integrase n=1 Tax=Mycobacterium sp. TaxID=1785 RepID=UPI002C040B3B
MNDALPLDDLLSSWLVSLKAQRKSKATVRTYEAGVRLFLRFLAEEGLAPELSKGNVVAFLAS